jgi:hypothetical protein
VEIAKSSTAASTIPSRAGQVLLINRVRFYQRHALRASPAELSPLAAMSLTPTLPPPFFNTQQVMPADPYKGDTAMAVLSAEYTPPS